MKSYPYFKVALNFFCEQYRYYTDMFTVQIRSGKSRCKRSIYWPNLLA